MFFDAPPTQGRQAFRRAPEHSQVRSPDISVEMALVETCVDDVCVCGQGVVVSELGWGWGTSGLGRFVRRPTTVVRIARARSASQGKPHTGSATNQFSIE